MELRNEFAAPGRPREVFDLLLDLEQVANCMPGATLLSREGEEYHGTLRLKVGPIHAAYEGKVVVAEVDEQDLAATLQAAGRELNGQGGAEATIRAAVHENGDGSRVWIVTDVQIRGKAGQFGRSVLAEVTQRVMDQFAANLEATLIQGSRAEPEVGRPPEVPSAPPESTDSLDVLNVVITPLLKKAAPAVAGFLAGLVIGRLVGSRRSPRHVFGPPQKSSEPPDHPPSSR